jgi:hypothetical protein
MSVNLVKGLAGFLIHEHDEVMELHFVKKLVHREFLISRRLESDSQFAGVSDWRATAFADPFGNLIRLENDAK